MNKIKAGYIGILEADTAEDMWALVEAAAKIGYRVTENAEGICNLSGASFEDNLKRLNALGIEAEDVGTLNGASLKSEGIDSLIERAHRLGVGNAVMYHGAAYYRKGGKTVTYDEVMSEIELLQTSAVKAKQEGVKLAYHNHDHEFTTFFNGLSVFDMLLAYAPDLYMELDVGWATYAGEDPVKVMERAKDRISLMHFKDFLPGPPVRHTVWMLDENLEKTYDMPNFCALGSGALRVHDCLKKCAEIGIDAVNVEQDFPHVLSPLEILKVDYLVMKESGLIL